MLGKCPNAGKTPIKAEGLNVAHESVLQTSWVEDKIMGKLDIQPCKSQKVSHGESS
jgi:hypothetical protein